MRSSPVLSRRAALAGSLAAAGTASVLPAPAASSDAVRHVLAICRAADRAIDVEVNLPDGTPAHEKARAEARRLELKIERMRARIAAKPGKTWDDLAVLAVIALYWDRGEASGLTREAHELDNEDDEMIGAGDRALPTLYLAVLEVLGIRLDTFTHA
jgi:hypothetical protein